MRRNLLLCGLFFLGVLAACTTTTTQVTPGDGSGAPPDPSTLPSVSADKLGQSCSGFGTGIGESALFDDGDCGGGSCLVDARGSLDGLVEYCSADCDKFACPDGYTCGEVNHPHGGHACFQDPASAKKDAGPPPPPPPTNFLDVKLTGYKAGSSTKTTIALRDYQDAGGLNRDLVIALVVTTWDPHSAEMLAMLAQSTVARVALVPVLIEGAGGWGSGATDADLSTFHAKYSALAMVEDAELAKLGKGLGLPTLEAVPTVVALDAVTMKVADQHVGGFIDMPSFQTAVDGWTADAKKLR